MLPILLLVSLLSQGHAVDYGTDFVTAFPENLAYYFPSILSLQLKITTLEANTRVTVTRNVTLIYNNTHQFPGVFTVIDLTEVTQFGICKNIVKISSDKNITVVSISKRGDSIQANKVLPTTHLGLDYLIPSLNYTEFALLVNSYNVSQFPSTNEVLMDFSYRLIIINAIGGVNTITVTKKLPGGNNVDEQVILAPLELTQLQGNSSWFKVSATGKVAVILTNPCMDSIGCRCNMISHQIRPNGFLGTEFIYPQLFQTAKLFVTSAETVQLSYDSQLITINPGSPSLLSYFPNITSTTLKTSALSSLRVIRPGLIIELLPKTMFAGCFLVHKHMSSGEAHALVIVEKGKEGEVRMDTTPVSTTWEPIIGTDYSHGNISISGKSNVIWHLSSKIGVYIFEKMATGVFYGGPAISINDEPDPNGCVMVPMEFELSNTTLSWHASRTHCRNKNMLLASPNLDFNQKKMAATLNSRNAGGVAWLGLRRSLVTSEWYWHRNVSFDFANWDDNQPAGGLCVSMKMEPNGNYTWSTVRCCTYFMPLCVRDMVLVTNVVDNSIFLT